MSVQKYYEVSCDHCGGTSHYLLGMNWITQARNDGYIVTKDKKVFCDNKCLEQYKLTKGGKG